jgi:glucose-1-phosphate thymidylyltransferase
MLEKHRHTVFTLRDEPSSAAPMSVKDENQRLDVVGLIPAGGRATRIAPLPCSKELYPIGFQSHEGKAAKRPKVVCHYLLEKMQQAGITKAYIVVRDGKWDIPAYLGNGAMLGMHLAYLTVGSSFGPPYTLDEAYPFVRQAIVAFGFPDILFEAESPFTELLRRQESHHADVVLGLFPAAEPQKMDMVDLGDGGCVREIVIQPQQTDLCYSWDIAVWTPTFTEFLHEYLRIHRTSAPMSPELSVGNVIQTAIGQKLRVEGVPVSNDPYLDIGTPEGLEKALRRFAH